MFQRYALFAVLSILPGLMILNGCGTPSPTSATGSSAPSYSLDTSFGSSGVTVMNDPIGVAVSGADLWVVNFGNNSLQEWTTAGSPITQITSFGTTDTFSEPFQVAVGADGYVYVADVNHHQVEEFDGAGGYVTHFANTQLGSDFPYGVAVNSTYAYVADGTSNLVYRYTLSGTGNSKTFTTPVSFPGGSTYIRNIALDSQGNVYVLDAGNERVNKFDSAGVSQLAVTQSIAAPGGVVVDNSGYIYVPQTGPGISPTPFVEEFDVSGNPVASFGAGIINGPGDASLDAAGNLYVAERNPHSRVTRFKKN
jgi:streptogramin lyase